MRIQESLNGIITIIGDREFFFYKFCDISSIVVDEFLLNYSRVGCFDAKNHTIFGADPNHSPYPGILTDFF